VKVTFTVQLAFMASVLQLSVSPKSPLGLMEILALIEPVFFSVTLWLALVAPTACLVLKSESWRRFHHGNTNSLGDEKGSEPNTAQPVQPEG